MIEKTKNTSIVAEVENYELTETIRKILNTIGADLMPFDGLGDSLDARLFQTSTIKGKLEEKEDYLEDYSEKELSQFEEFFKPFSLHKYLMILN